MFGFSPFSSAPFSSIPSAKGYTITALYGIYSITGQNAIISKASAPVTGNQIFFIEIRTFTDRRRI